MSKYDWLYGMNAGEAMHVLAPEKVSDKVQSKRIRQRIADSERLKHFEWSVVIHPKSGVIVHRKT